SGHETPRSLSTSFCGSMTTRAVSFLLNCMAGSVRRAVPCTRHCPADDEPINGNVAYGERRSSKCHCESRPLFRALGQRRNYSFCFMMAIVECVLVPPLGVCTIIFLMRASVQG